MTDYQINLTIGYNGSLTDYQFATVFSMNEYIAHRLAPLVSENKCALIMADETVHGSAAKRYDIIGGKNFAANVSKLVMRSWPSHQAYFVFVYDTRAECEQTLNDYTEAIGCGVISHN